MAAITAVLADYPREVISEVTNPRTGLPRTHTFMPSVAEIVTACDAAKKFLDTVEFMTERGWKWNHVNRKWEHP